MRDVAGSDSAYLSQIEIVAVCMRTALFTDVGIYEACNNKMRYYRKSVMRRVYLGE